MAEVFGEYVVGLFRIVNKDACDNTNGSTKDAYRYF